MKTIKPHPLHRTITAFKPTRELAYVHTVRALGTMLDAGAGPDQLSDALLDCLVLDRHPAVLAAVIDIIIEYRKPRSDKDTKKGYTREEIIEMGIKERNAIRANRRASMRLSAEHAPTPTMPQREKLTEQLRARGFNVALARGLNKER